MNGFYLESIQITFLNFNNCLNWNNLMSIIQIIYPQNVFVYIGNTSTQVKSQIIGNSN